MNNLILRVGSEVQYKSGSLPRVTGRRSFRSGSTRTAVASIPPATFPGPPVPAASTPPAPANSVARIISISAGILRTSHHLLGFAICWMITQHRAAIRIRIKKSSKGS